MVYSIESAPYSYAKDGKAAGIEIDLADQLFSGRFKLPTQHTLFPWTRAQAKVASGEYDAMFASPTPERLIYAVPSKHTVFHWTVDFFVRKGDRRLDHVRSIQDLIPYNLGVQHGNGWARSNLKNHKIDYVTSPSSLPAMLLAKRFDAIILDSDVMAKLLRNPSFTNQIDGVPRTIAQLKIHLMISKRSPFIDLISRCDEELINIDKSGIVSKFRLQHTS
jgi:polar amino acid transport system substrate-binding protein